MQASLTQVTFLLQIGSACLKCGAFLIAFAAVGAVLISPQPETALDGRQRKQYAIGAGKTAEGSIKEDRYN